MKTQLTLRRKIEKIILNRFYSLGDNPYPKHTSETVDAILSLFRIYLLEKLPKKKLKGGTQLSATYNGGFNECLKEIKSSILSKP